MPFIADNLGGGTLANKVAHQIDENRAAAERADTDDAAPPYAPQDNSDPYSPTASDAGAYDDDGPGWPDETAENAYLSQKSAAPEPSEIAHPKPQNDEEPADNLPPLDTLVSRIPAETRQILEELFRAEFKTVRKIPKKLIK